MLSSHFYHILFFYKHKPYKHSQDKKALKIKHMLSIIRARDLI